MESTWLVINPSSASSPAKRGQTNGKGKSKEGTRLLRRGLGGYSLLSKKDVTLEASRKSVPAAKILRTEKMIMGKARKGISTLAKPAIRSSQERVALPLQDHNVTIPGKRRGVDLYGELHGFSHQQSLFPEGTKDKKPRMFLYFCLCGNQYTLMHSLNRHVTNATFACPKGILFECPLCPSKFKLLKYMKRHIRCVHKSVPENDACTECDFTSRTEEEVFHHMLGFH